jgi:spermidine synthase
LSREPYNNRQPRPLRWTGTVVAVCGLLTCIALLIQFGVAGDMHRVGAVEYEVKSDFSHIRIRREDDVRTLLFVGDTGREAIESQVDLNQPHRLQLEYTRFMFVSYLFAPEQERALLIGLGGGAMVHFLKHYDPDLQLDVVEIDPVVVRVADEYFLARSDGNVRIINQDALKFLADSSEDGGGNRYDVIYMDAFLGASDATDVSGVPLHLKTAEFFQTVQSHLSPTGLAVFNLHRHRNHAQDVRAIRGAFPQAYVFRVPRRGNVIVAASMTE